MGIINQLSTDISNKIAAGEVVERPASAIKELLENAIDAGATKITVEIKNGGVTYMRVTDNGCGMAREDAQMAFLRHATSKIATADDLDAIYTFGFRGEALSSIGAVSVAEIYTKRPEDEIGTHVLCSGGEISPASDCGIPDGTSFIVNNLFYNTPARMNFLKKDATETAAVTDVIERFILSHPEISFTYITDGKEKYITQGDGSLLSSVYAVYGKSYKNAMIGVSYETELVKITGLIGNTTLARPNRTEQSFFVNKRYIKSARFSATLTAAYKNQMMTGKFPVAILNLEINPKNVNINVHPTKLEAKFSHEDEIFRAVYHAVQNALYSTVTVPKIEKTEVLGTFTRDEVTVKAQQTFEKPVTESAPKVDFSIYNLRTDEDYFRHEQAARLAGKSDKTAEEIEKNLGFFADSQKSESADTFFRKTAPQIVEEKEPEIVAEATTPEPEIADEIKEFWGFDEDSIRLVGQVFNTYIIAQSGDTMIIADQHAAHERLLFEDLKKTVAKREVTPQILMLPISIDLSADEFEAFSNNCDTLSDFGFEIEEFGTNSIIVRAVPMAIAESEICELISELLSNLSQSGVATTEKYERLLYTIACKSAVKANQSFDNNQLKSLLLSVMRLKNINTCPHGRPIIVTMSKKELEKEFKRII